MQSVLCALTGIAATVSLVFVLRSIGRSGLPGCGAESACDAVTKGRWAKIGHFPISVLGLLNYLVASGAVLGIYHLDGPLRLFSLHVLVAALALGSFAAIWFSILQLLVVRRLCFYCTLIHISGGTATGLFWYILPNPDQFLVTCVAACIAVGVLAIVQILFPASSFRVFYSPAVDCNAPPANQKDVQGRAQIDVPAEVDAKGVRSSTGFESSLVNKSLAKPVPPRKVEFLNSSFSLESNAWPLIGSPDANCIVAMLIDYTCASCHEMHRWLREGIIHYEGRLAALLVPAPLHRDCNPTLKCKAGPEQAYSCQFTRVALALWSIDPVAYQLWDEWLTRSADTEPFGLALLKAKEYADVERFNIREPDQSLDILIAKGVAVSDAAGESTVPAMLLRDGILKGRVADMAALTRLLDPYVLRSPTPRDKATVARS